MSSRGVGGVYQNVCYKIFASYGGNLGGGWPARKTARPGTRHGLVRFGKKSKRCLEVYCYNNRQDLYHLEDKIFCQRVCFDLGFIGWPGFIYA